MRLGDLDALKEDFKSRLADCNEWIEKAKDKETKIRASAVKAFIGEVIMTIDNAPTVEPFERIGSICEENCGYRPQGELADEVWKLYEKHHSHLATYVIEFGNELKELLGKYQKGGAE